MGPEIVVGILGGWLWKKLTDATESTDENIAIKKAFDAAVGKGYELFSKKYSNFAASLFDQAFLENYAGPELSKYLTRHEYPNPASIAAAYSSQFHVSLPDGVEEAVADFLDFILQALKEQPALQDILDRREIEDTNRLVGEVHKAIISTEEDWQTLEDASCDAIARIRDDIANTVCLTLGPDKKMLNVVFQEKGAAIFIGPSGCGKSALAKRIAMNSGLFSRFIWLTAEILNKPTLVETERSLGLRHTFHAVFANAKGLRILLVVDAMESLTNEGIANMAHVMRATKEAGHRTGWSYLLISQPEGWDQVAFNLRRSGVSLDDFQVIQASGPSKKDVQCVLSCMPGLLPIAYSPTLPDILTNLKLLDHVASQARIKPPEAGAAWTSAAQVVDWVWEGWLGTGKGRYARGGVLKLLAEIEADSFGRGIALSRLSAEQHAILAPLEDDEKLINVRNERVFFRHDSTADWARYLSLAGEVPLSPRLRELSSYPKWNTAIRLVGQRVLDKGDSTGTEWAALLEEVADGSPRGEAAQDLLLDAVILSTNSTTHLDKIWPIIVKENGKLLQRLLNRFLHVATIPDRQILLIAPEDEKMRRYLASTMREPIFIYWWAFVDWVYRNLENVINLAPIPLAKICTIWLSNMSIAKGKQKPWTRRKQVAEMARALARELQAKDMEHSPVREAGKVAYKAAFLAASEIPDEIGQWALEMAKRRPPSPDILARQEAYLNKEAERQKQLADPAYQERMNEMAYLTTPILALGPLRDPWPDGPLAMVDHTFQKGALDMWTLLPLMAAKPALAQELILSLSIEHPSHEREGSISSYEWCGLQFGNDGTPAMYFRGPFLVFLQINPKVALDTIIRLVNFATDRFCERMSKHRGYGGKAQAWSVQIPLADGEAVWCGDHRVFGFFRGETFNTALLSSALMAVEKWLYDKIEKGEEADEWIGQILEGSRSVAFAGLLLTVGKKSPALLEGILLPLLGAWQFYQWDQSLIMNGDVWRISMMNWVSHGEKIYDQVIAWHTLSHRKADLSNEALRLFFSSQPVRDFFNEMYVRWTSDEETREATKYIAERFNPKNYALKKGSDEKHVEIHFQWPEHMQEETSANLKKSEDGMLLLSFPVKCRRILDGEISLSSTELEEFWSQIQHISTMAEQDIEIERASQRVDALCGGIAVLFLHHREWLTEFPEKEEWCIKYIFDTLADPPRPSQFDCEDSISGLHWDAFVGEAGVLLLTEEPDNEHARFVAAHGVMAYHEEATGSTLTRAFRLREKLGEEFTRLLNLSLLWTTLKYLRPMEHHESAEIEKWGRWVDRLFRYFVAGKVPSAPISVGRLAKAGSRIYERRYHRRQCKRYPGYVPKRLLWNGGMHPSLLRKSLSWLSAAKMNDPHLPLGLIDDISLALLEFSISAASLEDDNEYYDHHNIPNEFDLWVFEVLSSHILKRAIPDESSKFWKPLFDVGPPLHNWPKFFLMSWFRTCLQSAECLEDFTRHWATMIAYVLDHPKWKETNSQQYYDSEEVICQLMGMDSEARIVGEGRFEKALESLQPYYDSWRKRWLQGQHSLMNFCRLLTYPAARPLRTKGVLWVREVLTGETHFGSREKYLEEALLNMLHIFWAEHRKILHDDPSLKEAFLDILTWLVQRLNPGALELQDEFIRSG
ncbi:MAG: ATP-binding protein [Deltaproteobacteria bacterium]|nr:ATP-binding protein [Deltaproteobacteria bacterium]